MNTIDIHALKFEPMNDEYIDTIAVTTVTVTDNGNNPEQQSSVASLAMGTSTENPCQTCHFPKRKCPGHPGRMELKTYVNNPLFIQEIVSFLKIICHKCGGIIIRTTEKKIANIASAVTSRVKKGLLCENILCDDPLQICGFHQPYVYENRKDGKGNIVQELTQYDKKTKSSKLLWSRDLLPNDIHAIFERISDKTLDFLGIPKYLSPVNYLNKVLYVPPNSIRPNSYSSSNKTPRNDLNLHLNNILKETKKIDEKSGPVVKNLQKMVYGYKKPLPVMSDKQPVSLYDFVAGKTGYIRGIVLGSRMLRIMRHFITGNPRAKINEVFIPQNMAMQIQMEEIVDEHNIDLLMKFIANGSDVYPRCLNVYKKRENAYFLTSVRKNLQLEPGDKVYRDLIDGDPVAFCRQPTLMKSNIAGMIARVEKNGKSFAFNPNITPCFAGDFDGDSMNQYLSRNRQDGFELFRLAGMQELVISNGYGAPIVGQIQDGTLGLALLTRDRVRLNMRGMCRMFENTGLFPDIKNYVSKDALALDDKKEYTGRDALTLLFEVMKIKIKYTGRAKYYNANLNKYRPYSETEINVRIINGVFESGIIDKSTVGTKVCNGLYHRIYNKYGPHVCIEVIWQMQRLAINYLHLAGYTMHAADFRINAEQTENIHKKELAIVAESLMLTETLEEGKLISPTGKTINEFFENNQIAILNGSDAYNEFIHKGSDYENNHLYFCVYSGSKGSPNNLAEVSAAYGQVLTKGERLRKKLSGRASHFFAMDSPDPRSRGFIVNSYYRGLTPADLVNAAYPHRIGIIDKALSTADSGTKYREGISSLEGLVTNYFRGVQKGASVRQMLYGGDGMDPRATCKTVSAVIHMDEVTIKQNCEKIEVDSIINARNFMREIFIKQNHKTNESVGSVGYTPVNIELILSDYMEITGKKDDLIEKYELVQKFIESIPRFYVNSNYSGIMPDHLEDMCSLFQAYLKYELRCEILKKHSMEIVKKILERIRSSFINNLEDAGACVGIRACQAISEPNTQQMLDSMHGRGGDNITNFKNIMSAVSVSNLSNPSMEIYLIDRDPEEFAVNIEMLKLDQFVKTYQIFYESITNIRHPKYVNEKEMIKKFTKLIPSPHDLMNWCIRMEFNLNMLVAKSISIEEIYISLMSKYSFIYIVYDTMNGNNVMRIYFRSEAISKYGMNTSIEVNKFLEEISESIVRGIDGIKTAIVKTKNTATIENDKIIYKQTKYILTEGTNMAEVMFLDGVDLTKTRSNSINEMHEFFGITTSRNLAVDDLRTAVEGAYYAHYTIFGDEMTSTDNFTALNRNGSTARNTSILSLIADSSFLRFLKTAALQGTTDEITSINSALISGTSGKIGTAYAQVTINEGFCKKIGQAELEELENI